MEVHAESCDVRGSKQTTNIGYFCVSGFDECKVKIKFAQVIPATVEQTERFNASLGRLLIAAVTLEGFQNDQTLDSTLSAAACSASHLLRAHDDSIWNSSSAVAVLSPSFQLDCARSLAHNDVCGLVCASADARSGEGAFETLHSGQDANSVVIKRRISGGGGLTLACVVDIQVPCSSYTSAIVQLCVQVGLLSLRDLLMDMKRRGDWVILQVVFGCVSHQRLSKPRTP